MTNTELNRVFFISLFIKSRSTFFLSLFMILRIPRFKDSQGSTLSVSFPCLNISGRRRGFKTRNYGCYVQQKHRGTVE